jgi:hypothetical protein
MDFVLVSTPYLVPDLMRRRFAQGDRLGIHKHPAQ